jgi:hypothetical protein
LGSVLLPKEQATAHEAAPILLMVEHIVPLHCNAMDNNIPQGRADWIAQGRNTTRISSSKIGRQPTSGAGKNILVDQTRVPFFLREKAGFLEDIYTLFAVIHGPFLRILNRQSCYKL